MADDIRQHRLTCSYYVPVSLTIRQAFNRFIRFRERAVGIPPSSVRASFPAPARAERRVLRASCPSVDIEARPAPARSDRARDRKSVVSGKSVSVRVDLGGRRIIKQKNLSSSIIII